MNTVPKEIQAVIIYFAIPLISDEWHPRAIRRVCRLWRGIYGEFGDHRFVSSVCSNTKHSNIIMSWVIVGMCATDYDFVNLRMDFLISGRPDVFRVIYSTTFTIIHGFMIKPYFPEDSDPHFLACLFTGMQDKHKVMWTAEMLGKWLKENGVRYESLSWNDEYRMPSYAMSIDTCRRLIYVMLKQYSKIDYYNIKLTREKTIIENDVVEEVEATDTNLVINDLKKTTSLMASQSMEVIKLCGGDTDHMY